MLRLLQVEELERLMLELPELVGLQERRAADFPSRADRWMHALEEALTANRLYQAGLVAGIRSTLTVTDQGQIPPGLEYRGRPTRNRVMASVASASLQRSAEVAAGVIGDNRHRIDEGERLVQQLVAALRSQGLQARPEGVDNESYLRMLRRGMAQNAEIESVLVHLEGLVGPQDALVLLDRALAATEPRVVEPPPKKPARRATLKGQGPRLAGGASR